MLLMVEDLKNELRKHKVRFHPDSAILVASGYQFDPAKGARITIEADRESLFFSGFGRIQFSQLNDITGNDIDRFGYVNSEWWDTLYPAIKSIISRIGSPEPELTEASTEDKIHIILQSHNVEQSDEECERTGITEDGFARIYASDLVIVIQPEEEVMHISNVATSKTHTYGYPEWDNLDASDFPVNDIDYLWWLDNLKPALFEIVELLESPDTSGETKPDHSPEAPEVETVIQLRKQVEELQGRLTELQTDQDELHKLYDQQMESKKRLLANKSERIEELTEIADGYYKRLELYQWAFEDYLNTVREVRKGTTNDPT